MALGINEWATALLCNGSGRYAEALAAAQRGCEHDDVGLFAWSLVELIEAGVRCGATDASAAALDRLSARTRASGTDWALGIEAGSRALLSDGQAAEPLYREAVERLERSRGVVHADPRPAPVRRMAASREPARRRPRAASSRLRPLHPDRGRGRSRSVLAAELLATGETVRKRRVDTRDELTPQEKQIARLARDGLSNPDIGARLFLSPRTVEWHLRKVFTKLEIRSRHELSSAMPGSESELAPA